MRVDEAGHEIAPRGIERLLPLVVPDPGDEAVHDRQVALEPLARED